MRWFHSLSPLKTNNKTYSIKFMLLLSLSMHAVSGWRRNSKLDFHFMFVSCFLFIDLLSFCSFLILFIWPLCGIVRTQNKAKQRLQSPYIQIIFGLSINDDYLEKKTRKNVLEIFQHLEKNQRGFPVWSSGAVHSFSFQHWHCSHSEVMLHINDSLHRLKLVCFANDLKFSSLSVKPKAIFLCMSSSHVLHKCISSGVITKQLW